MLSFPVQFLPCFSVPSLCFPDIPSLLCLRPLFVSLPPVHLFWALPLLLGVWGALLSWKSLSPDNTVDTYLHKFRERTQAAPPLIFWTTCVFNFHYVKFLRLSCWVHVFHARLRLRLWSGSEDQAAAINNSTRKSILDVLKAIYLRLKNTTVHGISVVMSWVNTKCANGGSRIKVKNKADETRIRNHECDRNMHERQKRLDQRSQGENQRWNQ